MERSGTSVAGQAKEAAVLRKGGNRKKRTTKELSIFSIAARYTLAHTKAAARSGDAGNTDFPPRFFIGWALRWDVSLFTFFSFFTLCVLMDLRWFEVADRVRNEVLDGWL